MTLTEHVHIDRPPEDVWNVIENPETMKLWNPNVKHVVLYNWGARSQGFRYRITYALSGKANELDAEMLEYRPPVRLVIKLTGGRFARKTCIHEIYDLVPVEGGTRLEQTIDIHDAGIPLLYRMLIWFIRRFAKPTGPSYLAGVKALVEGKQASGLST